MNTYKIETFRLDDGSWKAAAFQCGRYLGEAVDFDEASAVREVSHCIVSDIYDRAGR
jgi:hypothetical protein